MTDFITELANELNKSFNLTIANPGDLKAAMITAADNTLEAALTGQHQDSLTKEEIAYIVTGLTIGIDRRIIVGLQPRKDNPHD